MVLVVVVACTMQCQCDYDENPSECCTTVILASSGAAASKQWDRMGTFRQTGRTLHGRLVYKHQHRHQHIFYIFGQFDGWLVGRLIVTAQPLV